MAAAPSIALNDVFSQVQHHVFYVGVLCGNFETFCLGKCNGIRKEGSSILSRYVLLILLVSSVFERTSYTAFFHLIQLSKKRTAQHK